MSIVAANQVVEQLKQTILAIVQAGIVHVAQTELQFKEPRTCEVELEHISEEDYFLVRDELITNLGYEVVYDKATSIMKVSWLKEYHRQLNRSKKELKEINNSTTYPIGEIKARVINQSGNTVHGDMSAGDINK